MLDNRFEMAIKPDITCREWPGDKAIWLPLLSIIDITLVPTVSHLRVWMTFEPFPYFTQFYCIWNALYLHVHNVGRSLGLSHTCNTLLVVQWCLYSVMLLPCLLINFPPVLPSTGHTMYQEVGFSSFHVLSYWYKGEICSKMSNDRLLMQLCTLYMYWYVLFCWCATKSTVIEQLVHVQFNSETRVQWWQMHTCMMKVK